MFDFHIHSNVSFDSSSEAADIVAAAKAAGLREICFTDHYDFNVLDGNVPEFFRLPRYAEVYDNLHAEGIAVRYGVEFGIMPDNAHELKNLLSKRNFDFVIGSVHTVDGFEIYGPPFWQGKAVTQCFRKYLETTLASVSAHSDFDVLGHLTYASKCPPNTEKKRIEYADFSDIIDEILLTLAKNGKGLEINTSGMDKLGAFLPDESIIRRFRELGGEIVTVGSDAHAPDRVGQYSDEALDICRRLFGYVCTFNNRQPVFHKL